MKKLAHFQIKKIYSVKDFETNYVNSFIGEIIQINSNSIDVEFDHTIVNLINYDIWETCKIGVRGRLFALMDSKNLGRLIAFSPMSLEQTNRYCRMLEVKLPAEQIK